MAKNVLPVDFQDDILAESMNGRRKYQMITNSDGTVSFVDVTEYTQVGSNFGQAQVNATNEAVNESADKNKIIDDKDDLVANSQAGMMAGALAVKAIREELNQKILKRKVISVSVDSGITLQEVKIPEANIIYSVMFFYTEGLYYLIMTDGYSLAISLSTDNQITLIKFGGSFTAKRELKMVVLYM